MVQEGKLDLTIGKDSLSTAQTDSAAMTSEPVYGIILTPPKEETTPELRSDNQTGVSFIVGGIFLLFLLIALRFRNNLKYIGVLFHTLLDTRTRHNVFDDTVRETSMLILLNILWCAGAGIIGFYCFSYFINPEEIGLVPADGMLIGSGIAACYTVFMTLSYLCVGWVFSDMQKARMWVKGFVSSQALMSPFFFLTALLAICWPYAQESTAIIAITIFIAAKLLFIWKGYRIFFHQFSSWVLFLCYLCSLEIVPLVLICRLASLLEGSL